MNAEKAKMIPIEQVLYRMGVIPQRKNDIEIWYLSPFTIEKNASFKVNLQINRWYCHSSGFGGNTLDFVIKKSGCSISEALTYLKDFDVFFSFHQQSPETQKSQSKSIDLIDKLIPVQHFALVQYLKSRGVLKYKKVSQLKEVHYTIKDRKYFALAFINDLNGIEVRSKYSKLCFGAKAITFINNESKKVKVFEGFFDFLSWNEIKNESEVEDYIILNSISLLEKNLNMLDSYQEIGLFLDNDLQGSKATELIKSTFNNVIDYRAKYEKYKDLNEFLIKEIDGRL